MDADSTDGLREALRFDREIVHREIALPSTLNSEKVENIRWALDPATLWNAAEHAETKAGATASPQVNLRFPRELKLDQRIELMYALAKNMANRHQVAVDTGIQDDGQGYLLATARQITAKDFGLRSKMSDSDLVWIRKDLDTLIRKEPRNARQTGAEKTFYSSDEIEQYLEYALSTERELPRERAGSRTGEAATRVRLNSREVALKAVSRWQKNQVRNQSVADDLRADTDEMDSSR